MSGVCLDTNVLADYLDGRGYAEQFLDGLATDTVVLLPELVRFELLVAAHRSGSGRTPDAVRDAVRSFRSVVLDHDAVVEAARIRSTLLDAGEPVGPPDVLIGGLARRHDTTLVTDDRAFERVPGLAVRNPRVDTD